jgi:hypothetical protein
MLPRPGKRKPLRRDGPGCFLPPRSANLSRNTPPVGKADDSPEATTGIEPVYTALQAAA